MGPQGGVPLVLLNRFRGTIDWWDPEFLDYLAADHDVTVFDNAGVGYTDGEPRDSLEGFAKGAIEFIDALGIAQADLLGWSLGGIVAQRVAVRRPELVRRLVVAGSGPAGWVPDAPPFSEKVLGIMTKNGDGPCLRARALRPCLDPARRRRPPCWRPPSTRWWRN